MAFNVTRKGWIWIFSILAVLIVSVLFIRVKAQSPSTGNGLGSGNTGGGNIDGGYSGAGESSGTGTLTNCCGKLNDCYGLSKSQIKNLQAELNNKGCRDYNGDVLDEDGVCGPKTNSAINNCKNK